MREFRNVIYSTVLIGMLCFPVGCSVGSSIGVGKETVGYIYREKDCYSGVLAIKKASDSFSVNLGREMSDHEVVIKLTNLNDYPLNLYAIERTSWDRDNDKYVEIDIDPGERSIVYSGMGARASVSINFPYNRHDVEKYAQIKIEVCGLNKKLSRRRIALTTLSGSGP